MQRRGMASKGKIDPVSVAVVAGGRHIRQERVGWERRYRHSVSVNDEMINTDLSVLVPVVCILDIRNLDGVNRVRQAGDAEDQLWGVRIVICRRAVVRGCVASGARGSAVKADLCYSSIARQVTPPLERG